VRPKGIALADGIDDLAQNLGVGDVLGSALSMDASVVAFELLDLGGKHAPEVVVYLT
jgi:hypothetical protein